MKYADVKAVLLDIDGTLVDSNEFHVMAWHEAFRTCGRSIERGLIRKQIGKGADQLIPALLPDIAATTKDVIAKKHEEIFQSRYLAQVRPFPNAADAIRKWHQARLKVVLASSAKSSEVEHYVQLLGVEKLLSGTTSADDVERSKPSGEIFRAALAHVAPTDAANVVVVGDTPYDVIAARKCGIKAIALRSGGFSEIELREAEPAAVFDSIGAVLADWEAQFPAPAANCSDLLQPVRPL